MTNNKNFNTRTQAPISNKHPSRRNITLGTALAATLIAWSPACSKKTNTSLEKPTTEIIDPNLQTTSQEIGSSNATQNNSSLSDKELEASLDELVVSTLASDDIDDETLSRMEHETDSLLAASEEELIASEKRLAASEKRLAASEKRLAASEKKLTDAIKSYEDEVLSADFDFLLANKAFVKQQIHAYMADCKKSGHEPNPKIVALLVKLDK